MNKNIRFGLVGLGVLILALGAFFAKDLLINQKEESLKSTQAEEVEGDINSSMTEEEILNVTNDLLNIYYRLYYVTQSEEDDSTTESELIMSWMSETMRDKNEIEKLMARTESLTQHPNQVVATTAMALYVSLQQLYISHDNFITYLRGVDPYYSDLAEFQYQVSLFNTENKEAFLSFAEGVALYPYVFIEFGEDGQDNSIRISGETQNAIVAEIDRLFGDIFIENEKWHQETGNTNAVVMVVQSYRDFLRPNI